MDKVDNGTVQKSDTEPNCESTRDTQTTEPATNPNNEPASLKEMKAVGTTLSDRNLKQKVCSLEDVGVKTKTLLDGKEKEEVRAKDDLFVARRTSFKEIELEREKAVEKKALRAFVRKKKDKKKDKPAPAPEFVGALKDEHIEDNILYFSDASYLSPFFISPMTLANKTWLTCQHYYLAHKAVPGSSAERKCQYSNVRELKKIDKALKPDDIRKDWNETRVGVMKDINMAKFTINEALGQKLLKTGDMLLVYRDDDKYLANGDRAKNQFALGQNKMGEILMWVRGELQKKQSSTNEPTPSAAPSPATETSPITNDQPDAELMSAKGPEPLESVATETETQQRSDEKEPSVEMAGSEDKPCETEKNSGEEQASGTEGASGEGSSEATEPSAEKEDDKQANNEQTQEKVVTNVLAAIPTSSAARLASLPPRSAVSAHRRRPQRGHHSKIPAVAPDCIFGKEPPKPVAEEDGPAEVASPRKTMGREGGPLLGFGMLPMGKPPVLRRTGTLSSSSPPEVKPEDEKKEEKREEKKDDKKETKKSKSKKKEGENGNMESSGDSASPMQSSAPEGEKKKGIFSALLKKNASSSSKKKSEDAAPAPEAQRLSAPDTASSPSVGKHISPTDDNNQVEKPPEPRRAVNISDAPGSPSPLLPAAKPVEERASPSPSSTTRKPSFMPPKNFMEPTNTTPITLRNSSASAGFRKTLRGGTVRDGDNFAKRLIQCKGKRKVRIRLVEVNIKSLNHGDSFVLDVGKTLFVWNGSKSNFNEKAKALAVANIIKNHERTASTPVVNIDSVSAKQSEEFWQTLQGQSSEIGSAEQGGDDAEAEKIWPAALSIFKLQTGSDGGVTVEECTSTAGVPPSRDILSATAILVLDSETEFYVWVGRAITEEQRNLAEAKAKELLRGKANRPAWVTLEWIGDDNEPLLFREKFADWPESNHKPALSSSMTSFMRKPTVDASPPVLAHRVTMDSPKEREKEEEATPIPEGPLVTYPFDQLQAYLKSKPAGVYINLARIEDHLAVEEFQKVFKMDKDEFYKLPTWKRNQKKKDAGLF